MAIAFDASSSGNSSGGSSYSYNHTCTGSNLYLFVATSTNATAVTHDGVSMSLLRTYTPTFPPGTNCVPIKVWGLQNPATGLKSITVTSGTDASVACSYTGLSPAPNETYIESDSAGNQVSTQIDTITTITPNAWHITFIIGANNFPNTFSAGSGTTHRVSRTSFTSHAIGILDSGGAVVTPSSHNNVCNWTSSSGFLTIVGFSIAPVFESKGSFLQYF